MEPVQQAASRSLWASAWLRSAALIGLVFAAYAGVHRAAFVFDDLQAVRDNPVVNGTVPITEAFSRDFWGEKPSRILTYRPVPVLLSALEWRLGNGAPGVMHLASVLLHALMVVALYLAGRGLVGDGAAFAGAALMATLAAPSEAVFSIYGQAEVLAALFALLGLAAHRRQGTTAALVAATAYGLALGSKESALVAPIAWLWLDWRLPANDATRRRGRWLAYLIVAALLILARHRVLGSLVPARGELGNPLLHAPLLSRLLGAGRILLTKYARDLVIPTEWQYDCSYAACLPGNSTDLIAWAGLLLAVVLAAVPLLMRRRAPLVAGLLGWSVIFFAPTSNFLVLAPMAYAARWLYAPLLGISLLGGVAMSRLASRVGSPRLVWAAWSLLILSNAAALWNRQQDWETEEAFYESGLREASKSAMVQGNLAYWHLMHGRSTEAVLHAREAVTIAPDFGKAHQWLAAGLDALGQTAEADQSFQTAVRVGGTQGAHYAYALFLAQHGELRKALDVAHTGQRAPGPPQAKLNVLIHDLEEDVARK